MHEILAPFVALSDPPLASDRILSLFTAFVSKYLAPFLTDDEFRALKAGFRLFHLLLLYHDPGRQPYTWWLSSRALQA
jgi:hypothetical protein